MIVNERIIAERAVELRLSKIRRYLTQDPVSLAQLANRALQLLYIVGNLGWNTGALRLSTFALFIRSRSVCGWLSIALFCRKLELLTDPGNPPWLVIPLRIRNRINPVLTILAISTH